MAHHLDLEEQEQLDRLKHFWNAWGTLISSVLLVVFGALAAWNGYQYWQSRQAFQASALMDAVDAAVAAKDQGRMEQAFADLRERYAGTVQAGLAGLQLGKAQADAGNLDGAKAALTWVADKAADPGHQALARLRLASVLTQQQAYDEALKQLEAAHAAAFDARFLELKGDVLTAQGKKAEARTAYKSELEKMADQPSASRELLQQKLDSLGEAA